jgi:hypothetical protein
VSRRAVPVWCPRPAEVPPGELFWLDPASDESLLRSLHRAGVVVLAGRAD